MDPWSNIDTRPGDPEISEIDRFESTLGDISADVRQIRELITRFEICHFKYQKHLKNICNSIEILKPLNDPGRIGSAHIRNGEKAWENDRTGRSLSGQQYIWALMKWLDNVRNVETSENYDRDLELKIKLWIGKHDPDKARLVRLLLARLTYNWEQYESLQKGGRFKELEYQICRMDICHYAFPGHLDSLLQAIGVMRLQGNSEGCGSFNSEIKKVIEAEFEYLSDTVSKMTSVLSRSNPYKNDLIKLWLYKCLAKTLKEQAGINKTMAKFNPGG